MSLILDALRRSEHARRVLGAALPPPPAEAPTTARSGWFLGAAIVLLLLNGALLAWFLLREPAAPPAPTAAVVAGEVRSLAREADGASAVPPASAPRTPTTQAASDAAPAATPLADAEPELRARLAALHVDVHGFADDPAQRFVLINLKRRVVGDALDGGARLVEIVPDGAVVELDGRRVLLPRQ